MADTRGAGLSIGARSDRFGSLIHLRLRYSSYGRPVGGPHNPSRATLSRDGALWVGRSPIFMDQGRVEADSGTRARNRKAGKPETPKPRNRADAPSPASPLAFVLNIVVVNLQAVFSEGEEDLVPDCHARLGIAAPELLHHVFRHLS